MPLQLEIISDQRHQLGNLAVKRFPAPGGLIGRHPDCDWCIPDESRHLSNQHAIISVEQNEYFITDISTNGVYLNDMAEPLGQKRSVSLKSVRQLRLGNFLIKVAMVAEQPAILATAAPEAAVAAAPSLPPSEYPVSSQVHAQVQPKPLDIPQMGAEPVAGDSAVPPGFSQPDHRPEVNTAFSPPDMLPEDWWQERAEPDEMPMVASQPQPSHTATTGGSESDQALLSALLQGLGTRIAASEIENPALFMQQVGAALSANLAGMVALMQQRAMLKNQLRMDMTLVKQQDNNPIKFAADAQQALQYLFRPEDQALLAVDKAFAECYSDLEMDQVALLSSVQAALRLLLNKLSPQALTERLDAEKRFSVAPRAVRLWRQFEDLHHSFLTTEALSEDIFQKGFVAAYEAELKSLKTFGKREV